MGKSWPAAYVRGRCLSAADPDLGGVARAVPWHRLTVMARPPEAYELLTARRRAGMQQRKLAAHLGVSDAAVSRYERGLRMCPERVRVRWLAVCGE